MIEFNQADISTLNLLLKNKKKIAILTHVNPDGDAIGSSLGVFHFLNNLGHDVTVITPNEYPLFLQWLPGNKNVLVYSKNKSKGKKVLHEAELIFTLDFNHVERIDWLKKIFSETKAKKILIDHHPNPENFADLKFSDTNVSSTAELVYLVIKKLNKTDKIDVNAATCLYTGIMTDTGCFNYNCSNPDTFKTAAGLIEKGININIINSSVYDNYSADRMKLMGYSLHEKMQLYPEYNSAVIALSQKEMQQFNFESGDTEGFVNLPLSIKGIVFSVLLLEKKDHVKLSFRSQGNFPANEIAANYFEGGGHLNAAGGKTKLSLEEAIAKLEELFKQYKDNLQNAF
ncbi:MAG: bifunctional oligoribonuclease/PAP phosphatase NrnA [Chlorobi bacterium]|nr:bifunctional oligoribonuclease/PAP phosphatase NrnA [Chlorobiota bacterium]